MDRERKYKKEWDARFVDFYSKDTDHECALLGAFGYSTSFISKKTGLTNGQVLYRLKKAEIRRYDIRNGVSPFSKVLLAQARETLDTKLMAHLKKHLG